MNFDLVKTLYIIFGWLLMPVGTLSIFVEFVSHILAIIVLTKVEIWFIFTKFLAITRYKIGCTLFLWTLTSSGLWFSNNAAKRIVGRFQAIQNTTSNLVFSTLLLTLWMFRILLAVRLIIITVLVKEVFLYIAVDRRRLLFKVCFSKRCIWFLIILYG